MLHMSIANEAREWCDLLQKEGHVAVMCGATHGACKQNRKQNQLPEDEGRV